MVNETKEYKLLELKVELNIRSMGKPSMNPSFKREIVAIIHKYYPNWKNISYEFKEE